jgi:hypothetical protein
MSLVLYLSLCARYCESGSMLCRSLGLPTLPEFNSISRLPSDVAREMIISRNAPSLVLYNSSMHIEILKCWTIGIKLGWNVTLSRGWVLSDQGKEQKIRSKKSNCVFGATFVKTKSGDSRNLQRLKKISRNFISRSWQSYPLLYS